MEYDLYKRYKEDQEKGEGSSGGELEGKIIHLDEKGRIKGIEQKRSNIQPLWRLLILLIVTGGTYFFYWYYRNWKHIRDYEKRPINPLLRTIGLVIPVLGIVLLYFQFRDIKLYAELKQAKAYTSPLLMTIVFVLIVPLGPIIIQSTLNRYWHKKQRHFLVRKWFSKGETVLLIIFLTAYIINFVNIF